MSRYVAALAIAFLAGTLDANAQQAATLTPQDYIAIQQLVSKYAYAIDECTNRGYDYADLYTPDGSFSVSRGGKILSTSAGRDKLAAAARGNMEDCKDVPWAGIVHMLVNHVIEPAPGGATGKVISVNRETNRVTVEGVNRVTRHTKAGQSARGSRTGGLVVQESPIHVSNVAVVDPSDKKPTRIKTRVETVDRNGRQKASRVRVGVRSGKDL